ncbi:hypothetical protein TNCV_3281201 [Trichonephila clavipes]|nr:hypothetical protein TNCV_3281201 [Trichonephila clavipes]
MQTSKLALMFILLSANKERVLKKWALKENPYRRQPRAAEQRFLVNVWAGILGEYFIGQYLLPSPLDCKAYLIFLQQVLPELINDIFPCH